MQEPLFAPGRMAVVSQTAEPFIAKNRFILNVDPARVMIFYIEGRFPTWFLGKVEQPTGGSTLRYYELQRAAPDDLILNELGGEANAETMLAEMWALMERQRSGQDGILAINGWGNIFYVRHGSSTLRQVAAHWCEGGWFIEASRLRSEAWRPVRDRVFARSTADSAIHMPGREIGEFT